MDNGNGKPAEDERVSLSIRLSFFPKEYLVSAISRLVSDVCQIGMRDLDISSLSHGGRTSSPRTSRSVRRTHARASSRWSCRRRCRGRSRSVRSMGARA